MRAAQTPTGDFTQAKNGVVIVALAGGLCLILLFCALLRHTMRTPFGLDAPGYDVSVPDGFCYEARVGAGDGALHIEGWACVAGEGLYTVNNWVVLYSKATRQYLRLPTAMELDEGATAAIDDGAGYARAGFTSLTPLKLLDKGDYELCFAYCSNGRNQLVHTGRDVVL